MNCGTIIEAKAVNLVGLSGNRFAWALWVIGADGEEVGMHAAPLTYSVGTMFRPKPGMTCSWTSAHVYVHGDSTLNPDALAFHLVGQPFKPHAEGYDRRGGKRNLGRRK